MEAVQLSQLVHGTPVFMRVLQNPVVRNNAAWGQAKSMEKQPFSTVFLGFCAYFAYFYRKSPVFGGIDAARSTFNGHNRPL
jgi:hypothetical protein